MFHVKIVIFCLFCLFGSLLVYSSRRLFLWKENRRESLKFIELGASEEEVDLTFVNQRIADWAHLAFTHMVCTIALGISLLYLDI